MAQRLKINYQNGPQTESAVFNADDIFRAVFVPDGFGDNMVYLYTSTGSYFTLRSVGGDFGSSAKKIEAAVNDALTSSPQSSVIELNFSNITGVQDIISNPI